MTLHSAARRAADLMLKLSGSTRLVSRACSRGVWSCLMIIGLAAIQTPIEAQTLPKMQEVARGIYAIIGDLGPQRFENEGLNTNLGFVIGSDAVLVINTGASRRTGAAILEEIRRITPKPIRWVVNLNSQSHYWWGNSALLGAKPTIHCASASGAPDEGATGRSACAAS